ncbi:MAG: M23 family metallopeptidase [Prevotella sp.]|jgi:murein DD-endopeptidase MepM/ murein hydrolase activator NlpD|nr:M23 family metallopeptidase [Prevotella sp.]
MAKKKNKHNFWKRLHFKYRLSVMNENTLEEVWKINASIFSGAVLLLIFAGFLITVTSVIIIATPIRYYLPGYLNAEIREKAIRMSFRADSLQEQIDNQNIYINNMQGVFAGKILNIDSVKTTMADTVSISDTDPSLQKSKAEREFVQRYEEEEKYNLSVLPAQVTGPVESFIFYKPVNGSIAGKFNPYNRQYGLALKVLSKETVQSVMAGTVLSANYDINGGYTIRIQHKNGYVSVYTGNSMLLKQAGDKVRTGEAIAVTGSDEDKNSGTFAGFELWYKGSPVNPEDFILFK